MTQPQRERRLHVRLKPTVEMPCRAALTVDAFLSEALEVIDVSVGGMAIAAPHVGAAAGTIVKLKITFGQEKEMGVNVAIRWTARSMMGVEFAENPSEVVQTIRRYVGELLERGRSV